MIDTNENIVPVLLGGDLNAYSMAMSFARECGAVSEVFARDKLAMTELSSFINLHVVKNLDDCNVAVPVLTDFAKANKEKRLILIPCADWYVEMLEYARDILSEYFYFHIPSFEIWKTVSNKASFTALLDKYSISHPKTEIFDEKFTDFQKRGAKMRPPFVLKPADSSEYWRNAFSGMKKVYFPASLGEALQIGKRIYSSGYSDKLILQEYVGEAGGKSAESSVLTVYSNKDGKAVRAVLGDVLLEELGPTARGNYSAIVTRPLDDMAYKLIDLLDGIGYNGVANFDILRSDGKSYCLELNARQGRSFDYIRCAGVSLSKLLLSDMRAEKTEESFSYDEGVWRSVGKRTLIRYAGNKGLLKKALSLEKNGFFATPYDFSCEKKISRKFYVMAHLYREKKRYAKFEREGEVCY